MMMAGTARGGRGRRRWQPVAPGAAVALLALGCGVGSSAATVSGHRVSHAGGFNTPGNLLIADQFNNRVIEVNRQHQVVWSFGNGSDVPGPDSIVGPRDAERVNTDTLIVGGGIGKGADPSCKIPAGCPDNRVIMVNQAGAIVWQYGQAGSSGSGPDLLNRPVQATYLHGTSPANFDVLITDQGNQRVIEVDQSGNIVWQYGKTGVAGAGADQLSSPSSAELLANGRILIADTGNKRVIEVDKSKTIAWKYGGPTLNLLSSPTFASGQADGDVLIPDSKRSLILIISPTKQINFHYFTNARAGSVKMPLPIRAVQRTGPGDHGDIVICDQFNDQVIEISILKANYKQVVFAQGKINTDGHGFNQLNAPADAKVIGDYNGLTPP